MFVTAIPFSFAALQSIFPYPTAPLAIILILLDNLEIVSELMGSVTELKIPSKFFDPFIISSAEYILSLSFNFTSNTFFSLSSFSLKSVLVTKIF